MNVYWVSVYLHLVSVILVVGLALFWTVMVLSLQQVDLDKVETARLLQLLNRSRWPHVVVPKAVRLPLPLIGWALISVVALTGAVAVYEHGAPWNLAWFLKMLLFVVLVVIQAFLTPHSSRPLIYLSLVLVLGMVVTSGLMLR